MLLFVNLCVHKAISPCMFLYTYYAYKYFCLHSDQCHCLWHCKLTKLLLLCTLVQAWYSVYSHSFLLSPTHHHVHRSSRHDRPQTRCFGELLTTFLGICLKKYHVVLVKGGRNIFQDVRKSSLNEGAGTKDFHCQTIQARCYLCVCVCVCVCEILHLTSSIMLTR